MRVLLFLFVTQDFRNSPLTTSHPVGGLRCGVGHHNPTKPILLIQSSNNETFHVVTNATRRSSSEWELADVE